MKRSAVANDGRRYVKGEDVWSGISTPEVAAARFYRCPIAEINEGVTHDIMALYRHLQIDGVTLADLLDKPTACALVGLATVAGEVAAVDRDMRERAKREAAARSKVRR